MTGCSYPPTYDGNDQGVRGNVTIPPYSGSYDGKKYIDWEMVVEQVFNSHPIPEIHRVRQATSELKDFSYIWWYGLVVTNALPGTWEQLKKQCVVVLFLLLINVIFLEKCSAYCKIIYLFWNII